MARDKITPADVEAMYSRRSGVKGGVSAAEPDLDPGEIVKLPTGRVEQPFNHHDLQNAADAPDEPRYSNDVASDWRRGAGDGFSDGRKPTFDYGGSWRRKNKGDTWE